MLRRPRRVQPLVYHCFKGTGTSHTCEIPLSRRYNFGSKSTKESRIWADDRVRVVVRGTLQIHQTIFSKNSNNNHTRKKKIRNSKFMKTMIGIDTFLLGYQTTFKIRLNSGANLCTIPQDADFCANTLSFQQGNVRFYGGITNTSFDAQDRWAESFYRSLVTAFDCPVDQKVHSTFIYCFLFIIILFVYFCCFHVRTCKILEFSFILLFFPFFDDVIVHL